METKSLKSFVGVCLLSAQLFTFSTAFAKSGGSMDGGGGDARCIDYSNLMGKIVVSLMSAGQDQINKINPVIKVDELLQTKREMKCLPVTELDRQARSYPTEKQTDLLASAWEKLGPWEKLRLTAHELSVLAGYEVDGEYYISEDIAKVALANSVDIKNMSRAEEIINNPDGSVTFMQPYTIVNKTKVYFGRQNNIDSEYLLIIPAGSSTQNGEDVSAGICKFYGYNSVISTGFLKQSSTLKNFASVDNNGHFLGVKTKSDIYTDVEIIRNIIVTRRVQLYDYVTCK